MNRWKNASPASPMQHRHHCTHPTTTPPTSKRVVHVLLLRLLVHPGHQHHPALHRCKISRQAGRHSGGRTGGSTRTMRLCQKKQPRCCCCSTPAGWQAGRLAAPLPAPPRPPHPHLAGPGPPLSAGRLSNWPPCSRSSTSIGSRKPRPCRRGGSNAVRSVPPRSLRATTLHAASSLPQRRQPDRHRPLRHQLLLLSSFSSSSSTRAAHGRQFACLLLAIGHAAQPLRCPTPAEHAWWQNSARRPAAIEAGQTTIPLDGAPRA